MVFCKWHKFRKILFFEVVQENIRKDEPSFPVAYSTKVLLSHTVMSKTRTGPQMRDFPWCTAGNAGLSGFEKLRLLPVNTSGAEISIQFQQKPNFLLELETRANIYPYLWDLVMYTQLCQAFPRTENSQPKNGSFMLLILRCMWYVPSSCMYSEYLENCKLRSLEIW